MEFLTQNELAGMRTLMHQTRRQQQSSYPRYQTFINTECPLFLSLGMRRMLEVALRMPFVPRYQLDAGCHNLLEWMCLEDGVAKAIAALICHHNVPLTYLKYFLQDMQDLPCVKTSASSGKPIDGLRLYTDLVKRMRSELPEGSPSCVNWTCIRLGRLQELVTATTLPSDTRNAGDQYGNVTVGNEDAMVVNGPPKPWFGVDMAPARHKRQNYENLPIARHKQAICQMIRDGQVSLIQGATGCGKTTQVPQYILEMVCAVADERGGDVRPAVRIVVTQPRRIAAITVATRVAKELGEEIGEGVVGYKIRGTTRAGPNCKILFCTTGVLLRRLADEGSEMMFSPSTVTHLLVDEVHERGSFLKGSAGKSGII